MMIEDYILMDYKEKEIWNDALFIFDSSALLNFYEYSEETRNIINNVFLTLKYRLWIPSHVKTEYLKNREQTLRKPIKLYTDLEIHLKAIKNNIDQILNKTKNTDKHPYIDNKIVSNFKDKYNDFKDSVNKEIGVKVSDIEAISLKDTIKEAFEEYFQIGTPFSYTQLTNLAKEGEFRYKYKIPPGYMDEADKKGFQIFGDLIIWKQLLYHSKFTKKSIIFVTDDIKEDWWVLDKRRKPIKPREELLDEIKEFSNVDFWMYTSSVFFEKTKTFLDTKLDEKTLNDIRNIGAQEAFIKNIEITANREEDEPWRIERLNNVAKFCWKNYENIDISGLHDHKGELTVTWTHNPTEEEKRKLEIAWEEAGNEPCEHVEHIINH